MRIGIDLDGTVYHWTAAVNLAVRERFGVALDEHGHWNYARDALTDEQWRWLWSSEAAELVFLAGHSYPGAVDVVNELCASHEVHFVTHRSPRYAAVTGAWVSRRFRRLAGLHVVQASVPKSSLGRWDVFIDDKPEVVDDCLDAGARVLVPARPWNAGARGERFGDWPDVRALLA